MPGMDELFMQRCLDLALAGAGSVAPNPMVGCVIVHENTIIGEGFHAKFGGPHAEVVAINSVPPEKKHLLPSSTLYVNLEPCSHHGKTPPCADLIIAEKIPSVVIGSVDPNPLVGGSGIEKLQDAGCRLQVGISEAACKNLNKRFFTFIEKKRPYVILKWAQTINGFIAPPDRSRIMISNEYSQLLAHKWRSEEAAIMVGTETALHDNPRLDARLWNGRNPVRVVIDKSLRLSKNLHLFDHTIPTIVFTRTPVESKVNLEYISIDFKGNIIEQVLGHLYQRQIQSVMIEGGAALLQSFIESRYWDEARIFTSPRLFKSGIAAPKLSGTTISKEFIHTDELIVVENSL